MSQGPDSAECASLESNESGLARRLANLRGRVARQERLLAQGNLRRNELSADIERKKSELASTLTNKVVATVPVKTPEQVPPVTPRLARPGFVHAKSSGPSLALAIQ